MTVFCVLYHIIVSSQSRLGVMQYYLRWLSIPRKFHGLSHQTSDQKIYKRLQITRRHNHAFWSLSME